MPHYYDGDDDRDLGPDYDEDACPSCGAEAGDCCKPLCECDVCMNAAERAQSRDAFERGLSTSLDVVNK